MYSSTPQSGNITITVDHKPYTAYQNQTILQVLLDRNIPLPLLGFDPKFRDWKDKSGLSMVELEDGTLVHPGITLCKDGLKVFTKSNELENFRRFRLKELLEDHQADCTAPCHRTCPAGVDIQGYLKQVSVGNFKAAYDIILDNNPLPAICGRVCPHPCEAACRRNLIDAPVAINPVKRFVADLLEQEETTIEPEKSTGKRLAIVGGGPSGLTAAYYSALKGHDVTLFERQEKAGGMMRYGIPSYRLPEDVLDREIARIEKAGVAIVTGKSLGQHLRLEDLQKDFDAVYMAVGSWEASSMRVDGEKAAGVRPGIHYLELVTKGREKRNEGHVVVVGGGNTAIDCARTALRNGASKVTLVYRRTRDEMPAEPYEVEEALEEGIEMLFLSAPSNIVLDENNCITGLGIQKMKLGEPDKSGRRRPVPVEGSESVLGCDMIISAVGQKTNTDYLWNDLPVKLNKWGDIEIDSRTMETSASGIFSGGDCVTGPATVIQAINAGRMAAESIDHYVTHGYAHLKDGEYTCYMESFEDLPKYEYADRPKKNRVILSHADIQVRKTTFNEVEYTMTKDQAMTEAERCLSCGCSQEKHCSLRAAATDYGIEYRKVQKISNYLPIEEDHPFIRRNHNKCIGCGACVNACANVEGVDVLAMTSLDGQFKVTTKTGTPLTETNCIACGQCVNVCPCGALDFVRATDQVFRSINCGDDCKTVGFIAPAVRATVAERYSLTSAETSGFIAGLLKKIGFDYVFDFAFAADLTIVEETTEFLKRLEKGSPLPHLTSCCPGWINFVEKSYPEVISHLSSCKSPQQMMGAVVKRYLPEFYKDIDREKLHVVSIVPCLAKKKEADRAEMFTGELQDVDSVLTTIELFEMADTLRIKKEQVEPADFDNPFRQSTGAGIIFGVSGGVSEAALRMAASKLDETYKYIPLEYHKARGMEGVKISEAKLGDATVRIGIISGIGNAVPIVEKIKNGEDTGLDMIEIMACPGGCISGAGTPNVRTKDDWAKRSSFLMEQDTDARIRQSQDNPDVRNLYRELLGEIHSQTAKELLHTTYNNERKVKEPTILKKGGKKHIHVCMCDECVTKGAPETLRKIASVITEGNLDDRFRLIPGPQAGHSDTKEAFISFEERKVSLEEMQKILK